MFREIFFGNQKNFCREVVFLHAALILTSIAFVCIFSYSTSPFYDFLGCDSSIFQVVGKYWALGYLPYVDLFENKGPLLFLINALGYAIYPRVGIIFFQIPAMYVTILLIWRTLSIFLSGKAKIAAFSFTIVYLAIYSIDGNRTEEWSMPFLMAATYFFLRGMKTADGKFFCPPLVGLINGVGFGAGVMLRVINGLPICCLAFLSAIFLFRDGEIKILRQNVVNFFISAVIVVLPFVIYFAAQNSLYEMLYGTILLNVSYTEQRENFLLTHMDEFIGHIFINFMPLYLLIAFSAIEFVKKKSRLAFSGIFCGVMMFVLLFKLSPYLGYLALITPLLPLLFAVMKNFFEDLRAIWTVEGVSIKRTALKFAIMLLMIYPIFLGYMIFDRIIYNNSEFLNKYYTEELNNISRLENFIPADERDSVMIWSEGTHASHWILATNIVPRCRFFGNIKAFAEIDNSVKNEWLATAREIKPRWIIYGAHMSEFVGDNVDDWIKNFRKNRDADVERLISENYQLVAFVELYQDAFCLYRRTEP